MDLERAFKIFLLFACLCAGTLGYMGHAMTGGGQIHDLDRAKACEGYHVFNGERVPKCR